MSERPTPETESTFRVIEAAMVAWAKGEIYTEDVQAVMRRAESAVAGMERQLAERDAQLAFVKGLLDTSERARRSLSDAADHLNARLRETQGQLEAARTALEKIALGVDAANVFAGAALARIDAKGGTDDT